MSLVVRAYPLRGSVDELRAFASELAGARAADTEQFYRHYEVDHESWHVQHTPNGPWVIAVTALADPADAAPRYAAAREEFHIWFKNQVLSLTGVDPNKTPLGPPTTEVFSWSNRAAKEHDLARAP